MEFHLLHTERKRKKEATGSLAMTASKRSSGNSFQIWCSIVSVEQVASGNLPRLFSFRDFFAGGGLLLGSTILKFPGFPALIMILQQPSSAGLSSRLMKHNLYRKAYYGIQISSK